MNDTEIIRTLSSILFFATPLIIAVCGEIITERSGIINLSLDGTMLMAAMMGFVVAYEADNVWAGFIVGAIVGMIFAFIIAFGSIRLKRNQVAIGFVLTLLGDKLSAFLGQNHVRINGPAVKHFPIPYLSDIPIIGPIFFDQDVIVYFALLLVPLTSYFLFKTQPGLYVIGSGERPESAFARGVNVNRVRYLATIVGGALVGIAGAAYSLDVKIKWSDGHTRGLGWIALAIVIFGGWSPVRGAIGALLFGATKALATYLQRTYPGVSVVAFNALPWIMMIMVLLTVGSEYTERLILFMPKPIQRPLRRILHVSPPMALGKTFEHE